MTYGWCFIFWFACFLLWYLPPVGSCHFITVMCSNLFGLLTRILYGWIGWISRKHTHVDRFNQSCTTTSNKLHGKTGHRIHTIQIIELIHNNLLILWETPIKQQDSTKYHRQIVILKISLKSRAGDQKKLCPWLRSSWTTKYSANMLK